MTGDSVAIWERGISKLAGELDPQIFSAYIKPLRMSSLDAGNRSVEILAPTNFIRNQVDRNFRDKLVRALGAELGNESIEVRLSVDPEHVEDPALRISPVVIKKIRQQEPLAPVRSDAGSIRSGLNPRYTFSSFVVGNSNQFCHAASIRVSEHPGRSYNPLFIYGGVGLGKTHLLHAIGNAVLEKNPSAKVMYMSSETFTNELIQALRNARMEEFKVRMRSIEVLLIDDIQFMCGKERTQEEFFHTFNTLYNAKHQIVITSDKIPQDIPEIGERLQTRFSWGLTADIQAPDLETRIAILRRKAASDGFALAENVAEYVASSISSNVRELEGALTRIHAMSSLQGRLISLELAQSALKPLLQPKVVNLSVEDIKKAVSDHFSIKVSDIISKRRTKNLSFPRHIAMYLCRKHTTASYPEIGDLFGGRDHSSVIHAANVVATKVAADESIRALVGQLEKRLLNR